MARMPDAILCAYAFRLGHTRATIPSVSEATYDNEADEAALAVIRAAIRPKVVTRERVRYWIPCTCIDDYKLRDLTDPTCAYHTTAIGWEDLLNELGIEVEP